MKSERTDLLEITWQTGPGARCPCECETWRAAALEARRQLDGKRTKVETACRTDEEASKTPEPIRATELSLLGQIFPHVSAFANVFTRAAECVYVAAAGWWRVQAAAVRGCKSLFNCCVIY